MFDELNLLCIDFESYYDSEYSLSKMPTLQYIRDWRWRCLGCGFQWGFWGEPWYDPEPTEFLRSLNWDKTMAIAHNAPFDGAVLWERYGRQSPAFWLDTKMMARYLISQGRLDPNLSDSLGKLAPLVGMQKGDTRAAVDAGGAALAAYGVDDVIIEMKLLWYFLQLGIPSDELEYMDNHVRMCTEPLLRLNRPLMEEATKQTPEEAQLGKLLRKDAVFQQFLESHGVEVEMKTTPKGKTKPAFAKDDAFMQALLEDSNPVVAEAAAHRVGAMSNLIRTRAQRFLDVGEPTPMPQQYAAAHTLRSGGTDRLNVQNLTKKSVLRQAIEAPPGYVFIGGDSKQVEARGVGYLAGDQGLIQTFRASDPYRTFGGLYMFGIDPEELDEDQRFVAKSGVLGLGFGQGALGLQQGIRRKAGVLIDLSLCEQAQDAYRNGFRAVPQWWRRQFKQILADGYITLPSGRIHQFLDIGERVNEETGWNEYYFRRPLVFSKSRRTRDAARLWHGTGAENITQAFARDVVFWQLNKCHREGFARWRESDGQDGWRVVMMEHDKGVFLCHESVAPELQSRLKAWLATSPPWAADFETEGDLHMGRTFAEGA